jgi:hypothetical protein
MANPKIVYTPAGGAEQTLSFTHPPSQQPGYRKTAVRHDNLSTAGVRESVLERFDEFRELTLDWIQTGVDLANWQSFLDYALTGAVFAYYPDAAQPGFINYVVEDAEAGIEYKTPGTYALKLKLRRHTA